MNRRVLTNVTLGGVVFMSSCGNIARQADEPPFYELTAQDRVEQLGFDVVIRSLDYRDLCIRTEDWIGPDGQLDHGKRDAVLRSPQATLRGKNRWSEFCVGGCGSIRIPAKEKLRGNLSYETFGVPREIARLPSKELDFRPDVRACSVEDSSRRKIRDADVLMPEPDDNELKPDGGN